MHGRAPILLSPEAVEGTSTPPTPTTDDVKVGKLDPDVSFQRQLDKQNGDGIALARQLFAEIVEARTTLRELKAKAPADGAIVLSADEAKALSAYATLGKPEDLRRIKGEHGQLAAELADVRRSEELRGVAEKLGVKFAVLKTLAGTLDFTHTVKVRDPKTQRETEVLAVKDGDAEPVAFDAYAAQHWADFLPALRGGPAADPGIPPRRQAAPLPPMNPPGDAARATGFRMPRV